MELLKCFIFLICAHNTFSKVIERNEGTSCSQKNTNAPLNFKLTKSVDIRIESNMNIWNSTLNDMVQTQIQETVNEKSHQSHDTLSGPIPNEPETPSNEPEVVVDSEFSQDNQKSIMSRLEALSNKIQNLETLSCNSSNRVRDNGDHYDELCKISVGISKPKYCEIIENKNYELIIKSKKSIPRSCKEIQDKGQNKSGIYEIQPKASSKPFMVMCDMETKGGGWTHIQRRIDGSEDFFLEWRFYKHGFGDLTKEFWMGLENIYHIIGFEVNELLVEIVDRDKIKAYAQYKAFGIGPELEGYPLNVLRGFSGDAGDSLTAHLGAKFSTKDMDQDAYVSNCADVYKGGWWYTACHISNLNGKYINLPLPTAYNYQGLHWKTFKGHEYCHASARMLVRPAGV